VRLAGAGRPEEDGIGAGFDEVEGAEVGDDVLADAALVVEVEVLEGLSRREAGGGDAGLASRSRQAARKSSWLQASARARSARRSTPASSRQR
jgi:hypothetical protein